MISLTSYLLQMSCWLVAFYLVYVCALKRETFFQVNRWFLNFGLVGSLLFPLIPIRYKVIREAVENIQPFIVQAATPQLVDETTHNINYWLLIYGVGISIFMIQRILSYIKIWKLRKNSTVEIILNQKVHRIDTPNAPFSLFNEIYVSSSIDCYQDIETIVAHEKVHINERHWLDLILLDLASLMQWFNPLIIIYRKAMMQNHEFLADSGTLSQGIRLKQYKAVIANQMLGLSVVNYASSFTSINSKNRLKMMTQKKSNTKNIYKVLFILPLVSIILMSFSKPEYVYQTDGANISTPSKKTITVKGVVTNEKGEPLKGANVVVLQTTNGTSTNKNGAFQLDDVEKDAQVSVSFIGFSSQTVAASQNIEVQMQPSTVMIEVAQKSKQKPAAQHNFSEKDSKHPMLYILDGKKVDAMPDIDPEEIESMSIFKGENAVALYGKEASHGAVVIKSKAYAKTPEGQSQTKSKTKFVNGQKVFVVAEEMPSYPGGMDKLNQEIQTKAEKYSANGAAYISFVIAADGSITMVRNTKSSNEEVGKYGIEVVKSLRDFTPGKQNGVAVPVDFTVKIEF